MPIRTYNALVRDLDSGQPGTLTSIGVLRGASYPLIMTLPSTNYGVEAFQFSSPEEGTIISGGLFDYSMAFFGNNNAKSITASALVRAYISNHLAINFPGGCAVSISWYNSGYYVTYTSRKSALRLGDFSGSSLSGLMSDDIYVYPVKQGSTYIERQALMSPLIWPFTKTVDGRTVYMASFWPRTNNSGTYYYPAERRYIQDGSSTSDMNRFQNDVEFISDFWSDVDAFNSSTYAVVMTYSAGGTVTPSSFFASANEPRMFTVTPDQHHAIHSVTAYNTVTNAQIPLQESAMDLLTGAKSYMFTMPAANVRIIVEFRSIEITIPVTVSYTSPRGRVFTTSFNLLYDDSEQREEPQNE